MTIGQFLIVLVNVLPLHLFHSEFLCRLQLARWWIMLSLCDLIYRFSSHLTIAIFSLVSSVIFSVSFVYDYCLFLYCRSLTFLVSVYRILP